MQLRIKKLVYVQWLRIFAFSVSASLSSFKVKKPVTSTDQAWLKVAWYYCCVAEHSSSAGTKISAGTNT